MKLPFFHSDAYAHGSSAVFTFRDQEGLAVAYHCEKLPNTKPRIRRARALRIGSRRIPGEWRLNKAGTRWTLYSEIPRNIVQISPAFEVHWAFGSGVRCADFETYGGRTITRWRIITGQQQCKHCGQMLEAKLNEHITHCAHCKDRFRELRQILSPEEREAWLSPYKVKKREQRERQINYRWVREFAAKGSFTPAEFKNLCAAYGNVCLCCGGTGPLVPDHVIPLESQGTNDISNIQPLCKSCNSRKGTESTDYRPNHQKSWPMHRRPGPHVEPATAQPANKKPSRQN